MTSSTAPPMRVPSVAGLVQPLLPEYVDALENP